MGFLDRLRQGQTQQQQAVGSIGLNLHFAVVDVETTGLNPVEDRVIEIAVVIMEATGSVIHEWTTLVNPQDHNAGSVAAVAVHGIQADWLPAAPTFRDVAGDLIERLVGRVLVAHNARFDFDFIEAEFKRLGLPVSNAVNVVDTVDMAGQLGLPRRLPQLAQHLGIEYFTHSALDDARATAQALARMLVYVDPRTFTTADVILRPGVYPEIAATGRTMRRARAVELTKPHSFLSGIIGSLPPADVEHSRSPEAAAAYLTLLEQVLEDGYISPEEGDDLLQLAESWGLSAVDLDALHREFLDILLDRAFADRTLTKVERAEVERASEWLGVEPGDLELLTRQARARLRARTDGNRAELRGRRVAFAGRGLFSNSIRAGLCAKYGITFATTVDDRCELLVLGNDLVENANVSKARDLGVAITVERAFWEQLGEHVPKA